MLFLTHYCADLSKQAPPRSWTCVTACLTLETKRPAFDRADDAKKKSCAQTWLNSPARRQRPARRSGLKLCAGDGWTTTHNYNAADGYIAADGAIPGVNAVI